MISRLGAVSTLCSLALLVSGCSMMPFGRDKPRTPVRPAPLAAAPSGSVTAAPLPPPTPVAPPANPQAPGLAALDPALRSGATPPPAATLPEATGTVTVPAATPAAAAGNVEVGRTDLLGGWQIASAGDKCQLFMTLTTWSGGYRASTRGCTNPALQKISAWNMEGRQVQLINDSGATVARLYPSSTTQFNGQTEGGGPVSVSR